MIKVWFLYMVRCSGDNSLYTGISIDVSRRIKEHNGSKIGAKYTSKRRPVILVYMEDLKTDSKSLAMKREYRVKHLRKKEKELLILSDLNLLRKVV